MGQLIAIAIEMIEMILAIVALSVDLIATEIHEDEMKEEILKNLYESKRKRSAMMKAVPQIRPHPIPTRIRAQALHLRPLRIQAPRILILIPQAAAMAVNAKEGHKNLLKKVRQRKQTVKKASRISFRSTWLEPKKSDAEEVENKENCITKNMMFLKIKNCFFL